SAKAKARITPRKRIANETRAIWGPEADANTRSIIVPSGGLHPKLGLRFLRQQRLRATHHHLGVARDVLDHVVAVRHGQVGADRVTLVGLGPDPQVDPGPPLPAHNGRLVDDHAFDRSSRW